MIAQLAQDPIISAIGGLLGAAVLGVVGWFARSYIAMRNKRVSRAQSTADSAAKSVNILEKDVIRALGEVKASIQALERVFVERMAKAEGTIQTLANDIRHYSNSVGKLEGRVDDMVNQGSAQIATVSHMSRQIERLFDITTGKSQPYEATGKGG